LLLYHKQILCSNGKITFTRIQGATINVRHWIETTIKIHMAKTSVQINL